MRLSITRVDEIKVSVQETEIALQDQLRKAKSLSWAKFLRALKLALNWISYWVKSLIGLRNYLKTTILPSYPWMGTQPHPRLSRRSGNPEPFISID